MPRRSAARLALFLVLAALWTLAAVLLWRTEVPSGLDLPEIDPGAHFSAAELAEAERFDRFVRWSALLSLVTLLVVLGLYALFGARFARESAAGRIGTGMLLGMLGLGLVWLALLPFSVADLWWARRHDLTDVGYVELVVGTFLGLGGEFLFISFALLVVMALAKVLGERWWIPGGAFFIGLLVLFALVTPYLVPGQERLDEPRLVRAADAAASAQGVDPIPVYVLDVPEGEESPNAGAAGLGGTRRILVWETMLDGAFSDGELELVLAHEVAHHAQEHIWRGAAWFALLAFPGAYLIARATRPRGGMAEPRAVPVGLFVLVLLSTLSLPLENEFSRRLEAEADWGALQATRDPDSARALFETFSREALTDPSPPTWGYLLTDTHPTLEQRIAMADAWEARTRDGSLGSAP